MKTLLRTFNRSTPSVDSPRSEGSRHASRNLRLRQFAALALLLALVSGLVPNTVRPATAAALAFPTALGFGATTPGGRGGTVYYVTNTNDSGPGSLRAALEASGPRIVIVNTSGTITLAGDIKITNPYISIYGNKAPGGGIQLRRGMINIKTHDVVIRYLKVRPGDETSSGSSNSDRDAITTTCGSGGARPYNIIIDHSSLLWGTDIGGFAATCGAYNITLSSNIMGEGIRDGGHADGPHSKGMNLSYDSGGQGAAYNVTVYQNLITTSEARMPQIRSAGRVDFINNVIYNWGNVAGEGSSSGMNLIGNTWRKGPVSSATCAFRANSYNGQNDRPIYVSGESVDAGMSVLCGLSTTNTQYALSIPSSAILSASEAYSRIVNGAAGAALPQLDGADARILANVRNRAGNLIDSANDVGGWPNLVGGTPVVDSDGDGMPDSFETANSFNPNNAADGRGDADGDGYTNVEEYLNDGSAGTGGGGGGGVTVTPTPVPPTATPTAIVTSPPPSGQSLTVTASDDAHTSKTNASTNYGNATALGVDGSPVQYVWLKFRVAGATAPIAGARVRMYASDPSDQGGDLYRASNTGWAEGTIKWNNQPAVDGARLASVGAVATGNWYEWNVTGQVAGDGMYTFVLMSASSNGAGFKSSETGRAPQLVVDFAQSASTATPLPTVPPPTVAYTPTPIVATPTPAPIARTLVVNPSDDSTTNKDRGGANFGNETAISVDGNPVQYTWLKFRVSGITGNVSRVRLRLKATDPSEAGGDLYRASNTGWTEGNITWNNQPAVDGPRLASVGAVAAGEWYEWDIAGQVAGDGTYTFVLMSASGNGADFKSKDAGGGHPELVIDFAP